MVFWVIRCVKWLCIRPEQAIEPYAQANKAQTKMPSIRNIWQKMAEMMIGKKQDLRVNGNILC